MMDLKDYTKIYVCGPTVYDDSHLGHARTYITVDLINRVRRILNKNTLLVMNITDIDDKIINKALETKTSWKDIAERYEESFFNSLSKLNIELPDIVIRVSEVIPEIVAYIQKLLDNNFAYVAADNSVYFDTDNYVKAGYLVEGDLNNEEKIHTEISDDIIRFKRNKKDFALWKSREKSEIGFEAEFKFENNIAKSFGRPGWHIECSAMIHKIIGPKLDIHMGGVDLKFPHHHNEILQANAFYHPMFLPSKSKNTWPKEFYHVGHLCIKGQKMSKSLKNFTTIDFALKNIQPNQLRWLFMMYKWQNTMELSDEAIVQAKNFDKLIKDFVNRFDHYPFKRTNLKYNKSELLLKNTFDKTKERIYSVLSDLQFEKIIDLLSELIRQFNTYADTGEINESLVRKSMQWILNLLIDLGFTYKKIKSDSVSDVMNVLINSRTKIRNLIRDNSLEADIKNKLYSVLDSERNEDLPKIGITLCDTKDSSSWYEKN